jgi:hypothetical protein
MFLSKEIDEKLQKQKIITLTKRKNVPCKRTVIINMAHPRFNKYGTPSI